MKTLQYTLAATAVLLIAFFIYQYSNLSKDVKPNYASTNIPQYKESEVNKLKRELDDQRIKSLKLQAALDSCKWNIAVPKEVTVSKIIYKTKKNSKALDDCNRDFIEVKAQLGDCIGAKSILEVEKDLQINKLKRQLDTCGYFVQEMDKALVRQGDEITKLTNEKDSLISVLQTPINVTKEFPCLKAKRGTVVMATVIPATGEKDFTVANINLPKDKYKAAKKSCKQITR